MIKLWVAVFVNVFVLAVTFVWSGQIWSPITTWALGFAYVPALRWFAGLIPLIPSLFYALLLAMFFALLAAAVYVTMQREVYPY